jgi:hypothetical protein
MEFKGIQAMLAPRAQRVILVHKVSTECRVHKVFRARLAALEHKGRLATQESKELQARPANLDYPENLDCQVCLGFPASLDSPANLAFRDKTEVQGLLGLQVQQEQPD